MVNNIAYMAIVVKDYDEAIDYYINRLGFTLLEDEDMGAGKRWVRVSPNALEKGSNGFSLLLAKAKNEQELQSIGNQTGGRVFLFYHVADFWSEYEKLKAHHVDFCELPREEIYGTVVVFKDLYGNKWDMIEPKHIGHSK